MKKKGFGICSCVIALCVMCAVLAGCSEGEEPERVRSGAADDAVKPDVDLTALGKVIAHAKITEMYENPDDYIGKTIKVKGEYEAETWQNTDYHYLVIQGEEGCCPQVFQLRWNDEIERPSRGNTIEVFGVFDEHDELDDTWYRIITVESVVAL